MPVLLARLGRGLEWFRARPQLDLSAMQALSQYWVGVIGHRVKDTDRGKTLVVRQTGRSDTVDEEGKINVVFERNGQPRTVCVVNAKDLLLEFRRFRQRGDEIKVGSW